MSFVRRMFTITAPSGTTSFMDVVYAILQVGISTGAIYLVLGQLSTWATHSLSAGTAAIVAAVIMGIKTALMTYFNGPTPPPNPTPPDPNPIPIPVPVPTPTPTPTPVPPPVLPPVLPPVRPPDNIYR